MEKGDGIYKGNAYELSPSFDIINHDLISNWINKNKYYHQH